MIPTKTPPQLPELPSVERCRVGTGSYPVYSHPEGEYVDHDDHVACMTVYGRACYEAATLAAAAGGRPTWLTDGALIAGWEAKADAYDAEDGDEDTDPLCHKSLMLRDCANELRTRIEMAALAIPPVEGLSCTDPDNCRRCSEDASTPHAGIPRDTQPEGQSVEQRARELLAREYERSGQYRAAERARSGDDLSYMAEAIRAIKEALFARVPPEADVKDGEVLVTVSGLTGTGKSAVAGEIEILCRALGLEVEHDNAQERSMIGGDWQEALDLYKPKVRIVEVNVPRPSALIASASGVKSDG